MIVGGVPVLLGPTVPQQAAYTTPGTFSWVCPAGVTSVSVVCVGAGGGHGDFGGYYTAGGGGALAYTNNITVIPGNSYQVIVGSTGTNGLSGGFSSFNVSSCKAGGGVVGSSASFSGGSGGTVINGTGGAGGAGGLSGVNAQPGAGGAGGYAGAGGRGGDTEGAANDGTGGGGGGGFAASGGGVGLLGQGTSGLAGVTNGASAVRPGGGGSGGLAGTFGSNGGDYGGGDVNGNRGGVAAVRIIWPGATRSFPSTLTGDL